jgi:hypothetical protein
VVPKPRIAGSRSKKVCPPRQVVVGALSLFTDFIGLLTVFIIQGVAEKHLRKTAMFDGETRKAVSKYDTVVEFELREHCFCSGYC